MVRDMQKTVAIGIQDFEELRNGNYYYIDKTDFIREWWESGDSVTLIARPRRFGKTLNVSMINCFFSNQYTGRGELFEGLSIWNEVKYRELQGTYPVINLSFANVKESSFEATKERINQILVNLYSKYEYLLNSEVLTSKDKEFFNCIAKDMKETDLHWLMN